MSDTRRRQFLSLLGGAAVMFSSPENVLQLFGYAGVQ